MAFTVWSTVCRYPAAWYNASVANLRKYWSASTMWLPKSMHCWLPIASILLYPLWAVRAELRKHFSTTLQHRCYQGRAGSAVADQRRKKFSLSLTIWLPFSKYGVWNIRHCVINCKYGRNARNRQRQIRKSKCMDTFCWQPVKWVTEKSIPFAHSIYHISKLIRLFIQ